MVPYADFINHENVDTQFDCLDDEGQSIGYNPEDDAKKQKNDDDQRKENEEKLDFMRKMNRELLELE